MESYPADRSASIVQQTGIARLLTPWIILGTVVLLITSSAVNMTIAASVIESFGPKTPGVGATQTLILLAGSLSIVYLFLHIIAAIQNEAISSARPPERSLHALCLILARLVLIAWVVVIIVASVVISKPSVCFPETHGCRLQVIEIVASAIAAIGAGVIVTALESCQYPFQTPEIICISRKVTCRVSAFEDDLLDRSISRKGSLEDYDPDMELRREKEQYLKGRLTRAEPYVPLPHQICSRRPLIPLLPSTAQRGRTDDWSHILNKPRPMQSSPPRWSPGVSTHSTDSSSSRSNSIQSSNTSVLNLSPRRPVTPSSSISNISRRSPLSTMRSVDHPDIAIRPHMKFLPPRENRRPPIDSLPPQLPPLDELCRMQRHPSATPLPLLIRKAPVEELLVPKPLRPVHAPRRKTDDLRVPGAYTQDGPMYALNRRPSGGMANPQEILLGGHGARSDSIPKGSKRNSIGRIRARKVPQHSSTELLSRSRYRERPGVRRCSTATDKTVEVGAAVKVEFAKPRRLSITGYVQPVGERR